MAGFAAERCHDYQVSFVLASMWFVFVACEKKRICRWRGVKKISDFNGAILSGF